MKFIESIKRRVPWAQEAAPVKLSGQPVIKQSTYATGALERNITPALMVADRSVAPVLSTIRGMSRLCFAGYTPVFRSIDEGDDTQQKQIDECKAEWRRMDSNIGRVGKVKRTGTLGLIRGAFREGCTFRQSIFESAHSVQEGGWDNFSEIQLLPGETFGTAPSSVSGNDNYVSDKILPGIVWDKNEDSANYHQSVGMGQFVALEPEAVLYIEDTSLPDDTSMIRALIPTIEQYKEVRRYAMFAERRVGVPNMVATVDARDIAAMIAQGVTGEAVNVQKMIDYGKDLVENQGYDTAYGTIPGVRLGFPNIPMPLNPWEADLYLKQEILNFVFGKDITEQLAQAISVSASPAKALLDAIVAAEREIWGAPFERLYNEWLIWNGYDLQMYFEWADWTPADKEAEANATRLDLQAGMITINEARARQGYDPLGEIEVDGVVVDERQLLYEEIKARKGGPSQAAGGEL